MNILNFIKNYWTQIISILTLIIGYIKILMANRAATKCSLRNDILQIYSECKDKKEISLYQLEAIELSYTLYKKLKGNSFVDEILKEVKTFKKI